MTDAGVPTLDARGRWLATGVVAVHAVVSIGHGAAHLAVPVDLTAAQEAFVAIVIAVAPVAALALLWRGRERAGTGLLAASMAAALLFGVYYHYLVPNADNVASVTGAWALQFEGTAALVAVTEAAGTAVGAWLGWQARAPWSGRR